MSDPTQARVALAIGRLKSLYDSEAGFAELIAFGSASIPALRAVLFEREPSGLFHGRQLAAEALAALKAALGPAWSKTVVMTATEFGRTARPNGSGGTDHGTASALFLGGGAVDGKRVIADWPGLDSARLYQNRDLAPTTDFRSVAKAVLQAHLGLPPDALERVVFPGSGGAAKPMPELLRI